MVSPLIALMRDQLARLPPTLPAAMLWGGQSKQEAMQVLTDLKVQSFIRPSVHLSFYLFVCAFIPSLIQLLKLFHIYSSKIRLPLGSGNVQS